MKYSSAESSALIEALSNNIEIANEITERLSNGCDYLVSSLDSGKLQGAAYTAGKGLFTDIIIPAITKIKEAVDDIQIELNSYKTANEPVSQYGNLDLEELKALKKSKEDMLTVVNEQIAEHESFFNKLKDTFNSDAHRETSRQLTDSKNNLESEIQSVTKKINELELFVSQVASFFSDSLTVLQLAIQGASQLSQVVVDANGNYYTDGLDMTWVVELKAQKIVSESPSLQDLSLEDAMFAQNLMVQYGFNEQTAREIIKVRDGIDKKFPDKSQEEKDYILLRVLGSASYTGFKWDQTAGSLVNYFYDEEIINRVLVHLVKSFDEIMDELGLSKEESKHLYGMLSLQHAVSGSKRKIGKFNDKELHDFGIEAENVYNISANEVQSVAKSMYRKADFTHQSITMATHLNSRWFALADFYGGRKNVNDLSGWEGDTTTNATDMQPSIGMDDYLADLDSVNIVKRMTSNTQSYTQAMNSYFNDLQSSPNLREKEFKQNVDLNEVKSTIFESLVPVYERSSEEQSMEYLKEHEKYNSSYLFIESLEKEEMQYKKDE
ncbi:LXG domain-containing protein [Streptococcus sp. F0442]|uniref:LXG domain-containing protein n=1 Tax=Streptococcus sp. F0442 TaxID=999425 RepID=UPI001E418796|nr:LXG domain-containing protein [Streptococcus sp. F0442]